MPKVNTDLTVGSVHNTNDGKLQIVKYNGCYDVVAKFVDTGFESSFRAENIRLGTVKDRLRPSVFGVGFIGVGNYKASTKGGVRTPHYERWYHMLERCYSPSQQENHKAYIGCSVCPEWMDFQVFAKWCDENSNGSDDCQIDKDGIIAGNKIYSPSTCRLISRQENIETSCSKRFNVMSPQGEKLSVFNLTKFCRDNGLSAKNMHMVCLGKRTSHKGWKSWQ